MGQRQTPLFRQGLPWHIKLGRFIRQVVERVITSSVSNAAKVITYYVLLAFFPMIIFVGNMLPYLNLNMKTVLDYIEVAFPEQLIPLVRPIIVSLLRSSSSGLLSIGAILVSNNT